MGLINIDSVPIWYEEFSPEFETWITNLVDSLNENLSSLQVDADRTSFGDPEVGPGFTVVTDITVTTAAEADKYAVFVTLEQANNATNYILTVKPGLMVGPVNKLQFIVTMAQARILAEPEIIIAWKVERIEL